MHYICSKNCWIIKLTRLLTVKNVLQKHDYKTTCLFTLFFVQLRHLSTMDATERDKAELFYRLQFCSHKYRKRIRSICVTSTLQQQYYKKTVYLTININ